MCGGWSPFAPMAPPVEYVYGAFTLKAILKLMINLPSPPHHKLCNIPDMVIDTLATISNSFLLTVHLTERR